MRGVVFKGDRKIDLVTFDDPVPGPDDAVIEMKASGLCGSDLKFYREGVDKTLRTLGFRDLVNSGFKQSDPIIAGHEPCGVIAALGKNVDTRAFRVGDRVMVHHYEGCRFCPHCRTGWTQMCEKGSTLFGLNGHGGHAKYMRVPAGSLVHLPDEITFTGGAAIACGTGTAYGALVRLDLSARDTLAVFGVGPVGMSVVQLAAAMGARVIAIDIDQDRVNRALDFGASDAIDSTKTDAVDEIRKLTGGKGASCAMDCAGSPVAREAAVRCAARWGRVAFVGAGGNVTLNVTPDVILKQLTIIGSHTFSSVGQADCAKFVADHGVDLDRHYAHRWTLDQAEEAYRELDTQSGGKSAIVF
jgi:(R,R)-butanediol dehydrogenase/meso-butanediol dehydrogenase/diacetyl reductase